MARIIIEYNPELSLTAQTIIQNEIGPSMISTDDDEITCQYEITMVSECLNDLFYQGVKIESDLTLITKLIDEGVSFIEF